MSSVSSKWKTLRVVVEIPVMTSNADYTENDLRFDVEQMLSGDRGWVGSRLHARMHDVSGGGRTGRLGVKTLTKVLASRRRETSRHGTASQIRGLLLSIQTHVALLEEE